MTLSIARLVGFIVGTATAVMLIISASAALGAPPSATAVHVTHPAGAVPHGTPR